MAKLTADQTLTLLRLFVRSNNLLKGQALDLARVAFAQERQYDQFKKTLKDKESGLRKAFVDALVSAGLTDDPVALEELARMR